MHVNFSKKLYAWYMYNTVSISVSMELTGLRTVQINFVHKWGVACNSFKSCMHSYGVILIVRFCWENSKYVWFWWWYIHHTKHFFCEGKQGWISRLRFSRKHVLSRNWKHFWRGAEFCTLCQIYQNWQMCWAGEYITWP